MAAVESVGGSLLVPSVQEMAKQPMTVVPERYIRLDRDPTCTSVDQLDSLMIPTIDMQKLVDELPHDIGQELYKLHTACKQWGFFQLINHGIDNSLVEKMKSATDELFRLPMEEKKKLWQTSGDLEGFGQAFVLSEEQKLDWSDMFYLVTYPTDIRKTHLFENLPASFRETFEEYGVKVQKLAISILTKLARALKMKEGEMEDELFHNSKQGIRLNYYPPCPQPAKVIGIAPHSDRVGLTLLLHGNDVQGLEICQNGKWIPIKPIKNAFVVNVGDILEIISNGVYKSAMHRATVNSEETRTSIVAFHSPNYATEFGPAKSLCSPQNPPLFKRMTVENFYKMIFKRELKQKLIIESMRIQPSTIIE